MDYSQGASWYADFKNSTHHYIIFQNKIFYIDRKSKEQYDTAKQYGLSLGIPECQVDFHPDIEKWKRSQNLNFLIFLQGTLIMHKNARGKTREQIVKQVEDQEESVRDFGAYIPIGNAVLKLKKWTEQGAKISYLSALSEDKKVRGDEIVGKVGLIAEQEVLDRNGFPPGKIYHRQKGESYAQIVEGVVPDILIEDDCESIGGEKEMTATFLRSEIKQKIKSIIVQEFSGIDHLPDKPQDLLSV